MKKVIILLLLLTLSACSILGGNDEEVIEEEVTEETATPTPQVEHIAISEVNFTQNQAEALMRIAVNDHCGERVCNIEEVVISGNDIVGRYTYKNSEDEDVPVDVVLRGVTVSSTNHSIAFFGENYFSDEGMENGEAQEGGEALPNVDTVTSDKYDLPSEAPENAGLFEEMLKEGTVTVYRVNLSSGFLRINGELQQGASIKVALLDLAQTTRNEFINVSNAGAYEGSVKVDPGVYYLTIDTTGYLSYYWSMVE